MTSNTNSVLGVLGPGMALFAALKANAYGHGRVLVAQAAVAGGATGLTVGDVESAIELRDSGIQAPILVYPGVLWDASKLALASSLGLMITLTDSADVLSVGTAAPAPVDIVLKVDVGHQRMGTPPSGLPGMITATRALPKLRWVGLIAHLYDAPDVDANDVQWQLDRLSNALDLAENVAPLPRYRIAPSTGPLVRYAAVRIDPRINTADPGRLLLGIPTSKETPGLHLKPAFVSLESELIQVRDLEPDDASFSVHGSSHPRRIGIVPIGRADGLSAIHTGRVLVCSELAPIVGQWIEHTTIDLTDVPSAQSGDKVVIIGAQGGKVISLDDVLAAHPGLRRVDVSLSISNSILRAEAET